jgi:hypothetical protein
MFEESDSPKLTFDQCLPRERSTFCPRGEKVAVRQDEGGLGYSVQKRAPSPRPSSPIFLQER